MCTWVFISSPPAPSPPPLTRHLSLHSLLWLILPLFNTPLAEPITLSPLSLPRAANPLPGLIEGDCISAGSHAGVVLKWRAWKQSDTSLHPYQCAIYTQPLLLSQARFHFRFSLLSPRRGQNASWSQRSLQIVSVEPRRRNECSAPLVHYDLGCELGSSVWWQCHF